MFSLITILSLVVVLLAFPGERDKRELRDCDFAGKTYRDGRQFAADMSGPCILYKCVHGSVIIDKADCEDNGRCVPDGTVKTIKCQKHKCGKNAKGSIGFFPVPGSHIQCEDKDGHCGYNDGHYVVRTIASKMHNCTCRIDEGKRTIEYKHCREL